MIMNKKILITLVSILFLFTASIYSSEDDGQQMIEKQFEYEIAREDIIVDGKKVILHVNKSLSVVGEPIVMIISFKNYTSRQYFIKAVSKDSTVTLQINREDIRNAKIRITRYQLNTKQSISRRLQTINTSYPFLTICLFIFQGFFQVLRNLIIIGLITNLLDTFLPLIILSQSFLMFAFFNCDEHHLNTFFYNIFNSKFDVLNLIRVIISPGPDSKTITQIAQYNYTTNIFFNLSGEFLLAIIFLVITVLVNFGASCIKTETLREAKTKMRPRWNALFMALFPRLATFAGFHFRMISSTEDIMNGIICSVLGLLFIAYFIQLLLQIRRINSKIEYIDDSRMEIGLVSRINFKKEFEFDCLKYSMLYYPLMTYLRLMLFFLPIGASYDFYYFSFGGAIISQLFMMMIEISSPGYVKKRDRFFYPLNNFLLMSVQLCIITIALAQTVYHPQVSELTEVILFSIILFIFGTSVLGIVFDTIEQIRNRRKKVGEKEQQNEDDERPTQKFVRGLQKFNNELNDDVKKSQKSDVLDNGNSDDDESDDKGSNLVKPQFKAPQVKIKKVRRGKII